VICEQRVMHHMVLRSIQSSLLPIFLIPVTVYDSVHCPKLWEFEQFHLIFTFAYISDFTDVLFTCALLDVYPGRGVQYRY
jgi:hypothetical protein